MRVRRPRAVRSQHASSRFARLAALCSLALSACGIAQRTVEERSAAGAGGVGSAGLSSAGNNGVGTAATPGFATAGTAFAFGGIFGGGTGPQPTPFGGMPAGGRGPIPGTATCFDISPIPPTCPAGPAPIVELGGAAGEPSCSASTQVEAGASGAAAGGATAGGSAAGPAAGGDSGVEAATPPRLLIDNLEDGDIATFSVLGGQGAWFVANDGSGQQFPFPCALSVPTEDGGQAMHSYGHSFLSGLGGYSLLGFRLNSDNGGCKQPVDASHYTGVEFRARGSGWLRLFIGTTAINPPLDLGTCSSGCYDAHGLFVELTPNWGIYRIPFRFLAQEGWGAAAPFDPTQILSIMWSAKVERGSAVPSSCFDFWIDEVAFYSE